MPADKACDSNPLRAIIAGMGAQAAIPSDRCRNVAIPHDAAISRHRNRTERCSGRLGHFAASPLATTEGTIRFTGVARLAAAMIRMR